MCLRMERGEGVNERSRERGDVRGSLSVRGIRGLALLSEYSTCTQTLVSMPCEFHRFSSL